MLEVDDARADHRDAAADLLNRQAPPFRPHRHRGGVVRIEAFTRPRIVHVLCTDTRAPAEWAAGSSGALGRLTMA